MLSKEIQVSILQNLNFQLYPLILNSLSFKIQITRRKCHAMYCWSMDTDTIMDHPKSGNIRGRVIWEKQDMTGENREQHQGDVQRV